MDETRRFLRYVMPGVLYGVETLLLLWIIDPQWTQCIIANLLEKDSLGAILGSVLVFGALGYIFAAIHHARHWSSRNISTATKCTGVIQGICHALLLSNENNVLDHKSIAKDIKKNKGEKWDDDVTLTREEAMAISYASWYQTKIGDAAEKKIISLGDQAHGLGTARVASWFALASAILYCLTFLTLECHIKEAGRYIIMLTLGIFMISLFHRGYQRVGNIAHETYREILTNIQRS